jgi:hypothetical protein
MSWRNDFRFLSVLRLSLFVPPRIQGAEEREKIEGQLMKIDIALGFLGIFKPAYRVEITGASGYNLVFLVRVHPLVGSPIDPTVPLAL